MIFAKKTSSNLSVLLLAGQGPHNNPSAIQFPKLVREKVTIHVVQAMGHILNTVRKKPSIIMDIF